MRIDRAIDYWHKKFPWKTPSKKKVGNWIWKKTIELIKKEGKLKPGVKKIINFLLRNKIKIGLASSSPTQMINFTLQKLGIHRHFEIIHSAEKEIHPKPHPAVFLTAAKKLGVKPADCLVIEDSPVGIIAAKRAGMKCVAIKDKRIKNHKSYRLVDYKLDSLVDFTKGLWIKLN